MNKNIIAGMFSIVAIVGCSQQSEQSKEWSDNTNQPAPQVQQQHSGIGLTEMITGLAVYHMLFGGSRSTAMPSSTVNNYYNNPDSSLPKRDSSNFFSGSKTPTPTTQNTPSGLGRPSQQTNTPSSMSRPSTPSSSSSMSRPSMPSSSSSSRSFSSSGMGRSSGGRR
jgi:hypothetical protein